MRLNRNKIKQKVWEDIWYRLITALKNKSDTDIEILLIATLTRAERIMVAKRLMIAILIQSGWSSSQIADVLKLSRGTIHKFHLTLEINHSYQALIKKCFPSKIPPPSTQISSESAFIKFIEAVLDVRKHRSKLTYFQP